MEYKTNTKLVSPKIKIATMVFSSYFFIALLFWIILHLFNDNEDLRLIFGALYGGIALLGGVYGLAVMGKVGGLKSSLGRTIFFLSTGLLFAEFGQLVFSYYNIFLEVDIPYPSVADVGFFGNIPAYITAGLFLGAVTGFRKRLKTSYLKPLIALVIPLLMLVATYQFFLKGYDGTDRGILTVFLDFGYPIGQATYISIALVVLTYMTGAIGGLMKKRVLLLIVAFVAQYIADFNFLYQTYHETWINGGYGDLLYMTAYYLMALSIVYILSAFITDESDRQPILSTTTIQPNIVTPVSGGF